MTFRTLIRRSLRYHWRSHLGVVLGAAIGSAALIGALVVGDSVKGSLRERALERLGPAEHALNAGDRTVSEALVYRLNHQIGVEFKAAWATNQEAGGFIDQMFHANVVVSKLDGAARVNRVNLYVGSPPQHWKPEGNLWTLFNISESRSLEEDASARMLRSKLIAEAATNTVAAAFAARYFQAAGPDDKDTAFLNETLANQLNVKVGDTILLRFQKPTALSAEAVISPRDEQAISVRLPVGRIVSAQDTGNFSLLPSHVAPLNVFVSRHTLTNLTGDAFRPNILNASWGYRNWPEWTRWRLWYKFDQLAWIHRLFDPATHSFPVERLNGLLRESWNLADAQAELIAAPGNGWIELRSERVFIDLPLSKAATAAAKDSSPILTLLANLLQAGTNATPYSMVTAAGAPWTPTDLRDNEIVISQWLAEDLHVKPGDEIALVYFDPESGARLVEHTNTFRVHSIVPMEMPWADRTLMPDFPGIEKAESTSEWDAGFPLTYKVRDKDDDYWKQHRGTPKAFITLAAGQKMWGNRFGNLTAIRFPIPANIGTGVPPVRFNSNGRDARATNDALPLTPALSPSEGERENRSQALGETKPGASSTTSEGPTTVQQLSPLLGGEGQGEGERRTNMAGTLSAASQTSPEYNGDAVERVPTSTEEYRAALEKKILANLKPEELGLRFEPVREQALKAAEESQDFGGLFLGFSFFVIAAALLLMALLFSLGLEQRAPEIGTLLALGFTPKQVRKLLLREGVVLSLIGGVIGAIGGLAYAKAMLHGLTTIWRDAVGASALSFHFTAQTLVIGIFASAIVSVVTIWLTLRKFVKRPARELLVGEIGSDQSKVQSLKSKVIAAGALLAGVALAGWAVAAGDTTNAGVFFGAGALILIAGLSFASAWLAQLGGALSTGSARTKEIQQRAETVLGAPITMGSLAVRGCARRRKRSLATVAMLACGSFLIVSIGVFRLDSNRDATKKTSGTGGFALIGETTMPVVHDLNTASGRDFFALNERDLEGVNFVSFRVREGDEASCLNLNRAQKPRLLGVKPEMLEGRFSSTKGQDWTSLISTRLQPGVAGAAESENRLSGFSASRPEDTGLKPGANEIEIPAIGDANSIQWAMGKKVGDTLDYVDERGQPFKVRIVGAVANSILQGQLIIDEAEFVKRFPGESGYRMFLLDAPSNAVSQVSATLSRAMQDMGLELTPAPQRLAQFNAVQNTYLGTFQVLGGLGLLLGSVGLGIVVLRNVLERRGELALLIAVGFRKQQLQRLLLLENGALLTAGLALGVVAAAVAVLPALLSPGAQLPYATLTFTLAAVLANGALWTWAATRFAVRGDLLKALRNE